MKKQYQEYMLEQLKAVMAIDSPSGYTAEVQEYMNQELARLGFQAINPHKGGITAHLGGEGDPIMLMAHVDPLGAMVDCVKPNGRLMVSRIGGLQATNTETMNVKIKTRFDGEYEGLYYLVQKIDITKGSVDLRKDGGVLFELDNVYADEDAEENRRIWADYTWKSITIK